MPGAVTVAICEGVTAFDPDAKANIIGVSFPGIIDNKGGVTKSCIDMPGWLDVPLTAWLESRLSRKVILINSELCLRTGETLKSRGRTCSYDFLRAYGAAFLALEKINGFLNTP